MGENEDKPVVEADAETAEKGGDAADESQEDAGAADGKEDADADDESADNAGDGDGKGKDDDKSGDDADEDKSKDKSKKKPTPPADEEPKTRKRNIDFIHERQSRKAEKQKEKKDGANDDDEDGMAPEDRDAVDRRAAKIIEPIAKKLAADEDDKEISEFLTANPDFKPYEAKVRKFAAHESRKNIPFKTLFYEVAGDDLMKIGANRAKKAADDSKRSRAGGGSDRSGTGDKSVADMTKEEFTAKQDEVRRKSRE